MYLAANKQFSGVQKVKSELRIHAMMHDCWHMIDTAIPQ
jgi:hypothetical protein